MEPGTWMWQLNKLSQCGGASVQGIQIVEMVSLEEMTVMDCLVLKDPKDLKENLVQQMDLQVNQELGEQPDHKNLLDQLDQGAEG